MIGSIEYEKLSAYIETLEKMQNGYEKAPILFPEINLKEYNERIFQIKQVNM